MTEISAVTQFFILALDRRRRGCRAGGQREETPARSWMPGRVGRGAVVRARPHGRPTSHRCEADEINITLHDDSYIEINKFHTATGR
jgi:hypothetical protein